MKLGKKVATTFVLASTVLSYMSIADGQAPAPTTAEVARFKPLASRSGEVLMHQQEQQQETKPEVKGQPTEGNLVTAELPREQKVGTPAPTPVAQPQPQPDPPKEPEKPKETYGEWQPFVATFYTLNEGSGTGRTATGTIPTAHRTLAVDPNRIPLGSVVEIKYPDGSVERRVAEDTGGAIHGNILDVYVVTVQEALSRGRQNVQLRIVQTP